jgi:hypothetical protein
LPLTPLRKGGKRAQRNRDESAACARPTFHRPTVALCVLSCENEDTRWVPAFIIRRAVADKVISEEDHHKLDLARKLIGMSEGEAEDALHAIMAEAEAFFGAPVKDDK